MRAHVLDERHLSIGDPRRKPDLHARTERLRCRREDGAGSGMGDDDRGLDPAEGGDEDVREVLRAERRVVGEIDRVRGCAELVEMDGDAIPAGGGLAGAVQEDVLVQVRSGSRSGSSQRSRPAASLSAL